MDRQSASPCETLAERYQALLEVAEAISAHRDLHELFRDLAQRLPRVVHVNFVALSLHDPERNTMRLHTLQANVPADIVGGHEGPVEETPAGLVWQTQQPILVPDLAEERRWPKVTPHMSEDGINSFCVVPLTTAVRRLGAMGFASVQKEAYGETDVEFLQQVGKQVAVAVDNVLHHQDLIHGRDRLRLLLEVSESIASHRDLEELFRDLAQRLPQIVPFDYINAVLHEPARDVMRLWLLVTATPSTISPGLELSIDESPGGLVWKTQQPLTVNDVTQEQRFPKLMAMLRENGVQSFCVVPLTTAQRRLGAMGFGSYQRRTYQEAEINFMQQVANQVAVAVDNVLHAASAQSAQQQLKYERDRLRLVLEINNAVVSHLELPKLLKAISGCLGRVIPHDLAWFCLYDPATHQLQTHALDFPNNQDFAEAGDPIPLEGTPEGLAFTTQQTSSDQKSQPHRVSCGDHQARGRRRPEIRLRRSADLARASTGYTERRQYTCGGFQRRRCEIVQLDRRAGCPRRCEFNGLSGNLIAEGQAGEGEAVPGGGNPDGVQLRGNHRGQPGPQTAFSKRFRPWLRRTPQS